MSKEEWGSLPYLDAIRPEAGWRTDLALLATYSADLVAVVAALLALAGLDDERGSGTKVDFANAVEALRDRARVIAQAGRVAAPRRTPKILAILDGFVREAHMDEAEGSWHPKIALVKLAQEEGEATRWRLWVGSRNLTRDISWDAGLALAGHEGGDGRQIAGVAELGRELAARAELPGVSRSAVFAALKNVRWEMPPGCTVEEVKLLLGDKRGMPDPPEGVRRLAVVSPFLDGATVGRLARWGNTETHRSLLSSQTELAKLAGQAARPLESYDDLLYLDAPAPDVHGLAPNEDDEGADSEDEAPEQRGIHAKLIYAEHRGGRTLWLGSANATQRGWNGPNAEVVARLAVDADTAAGLGAFLREIGRTANLETLPEYEEDELEERLELARRQVAARWRVTQKVSADQLVLEAENLPHPDEAEAELFVGLLSQVLTAWPRGRSVLPIPPVPRAEATELVRCEVRLGGSSVAWLQRAPMDPPPREDRDRRALARYLDPRTFLLWIRSLLTGDALTEGGGDWDAPPGRAQTAGRGTSPDWWAPTLEDVLKAWARDPATIADVDRKVRRYLEVMDEERAEEQSEEEKETLADFRRTWKVIRRELVEGAR